LDRIFSIQPERVVNRDNTVQLDQQVYPNREDETAGDAGRMSCDLILGEHLDARVRIVYGPHLVGPYAAGEPLTLTKKRRAPRCGHAAPWKAWKTPKASCPLFPPRLEIRPKPPDAHISTATTTALHLSHAGNTKPGQIMCYKTRTF
jgi:hypothetical protein